MSQQVRTLVWEIILLSLRIQISVGCKCYCYKLDIEASLIVNREAQIWDVLVGGFEYFFIRSDFPYSKNQLKLPDKFKYSKQHPSFQSSFWRISLMKLFCFEVRISNFAVFQRSVLLILFGFFFVFFIFTIFLSFLLIHIPWCFVVWN